ncbi:hypothetical protein JDN40_14330 [Rhodomicrobium vannielii ATCC 17100]|uniref:hypothetical protein n=1 Tax=Rhodomicrobium vannielii TaxID=1069 RepID=UPI001917F196|nr:hypothetical protein [Rhodomicrobium vannielii]MBJ7535285.1 hypothetical protein [Rhodomicrobium vannielii ATCC 17100]
MGRRATLKNAFPRGELDPDLWQRTDLEHYYLALAKAKNCIVTPQGGVRRRPGLVSTGQRLRRQLEPIVITESMITAANGGTKAYLVDNLTTTSFVTATVTTSPFTVFEVDLGQARQVCFVDLEGFMATATLTTLDEIKTKGVFDDCIAVEYFDGAVWQLLGGSRRNLRNSIGSRSGFYGVLVTLTSSGSRSRRFGAAPGKTVTARYFRVTTVGGANVMGSVSVQQVRFWAETAAISPCRIFPAGKEVDAPYQIALTDSNIDIFRGGVFVAAAAIAAPPEIVSQVVPDGARDTVFLFHPDMQTVALVRQGDHDEWDSTPVDFTDQPATMAAANISVGYDNEVQRLDFTGIAAGDIIAVGLGSALARSTITYSTPAALATSLAALIKTLPEVDGDDIVAVASGPVAAPQITVTFARNNGARAWPRLKAWPLGPSTGSSETVILSPGSLPSGQICTAKNGWPGTGCLSQGRLITGNFRKGPATFAFSLVGSPLSFKINSTATADMAAFFSLDSREAEQIHSIFVGQHLHIFTESGEWWAETRTFDATQALNMVLASRYGIAPNIRPMLVQGQTMFMQGGRDQDGNLALAGVLRDMTYSRDGQNYEVTAASILAGHLVKDVVDMAHRPGVSTKDASLVVLANRDGTFEMLTLLRAQEISAMTPGAMASGALRFLMTDINRRLWAVVERGGDGWLEYFDDDALLDGQISLSGDPRVTVTGLAHLEGEAVYAYADRALVGPFTVAGGQITLETPASEIVVGLPFLVEIETLPLREKVPGGRDGVQEFRPPCRVFEVEFYCNKCGPFQMAANEGDWSDVPLEHFDTLPLPVELSGQETPLVLDTPLLDRLFTGYARVENLVGWTRHGPIKIRQTLPVPFYLQSLRYEVSF